MADSAKLFIVLIIVKIILSVIVSMTIIVITREDSRCDG